MISRDSTAGATGSKFSDALTLFQPVQRSYQLFLCGYISLIKMAKIKIFPNSILKTW